jgi:hypothetical protein
MTKTMPMTAAAPAPAANAAAEPRSAGGAGKRLAAMVRRRLQAVLTAVLVVAGLGAWAVALVQPWAGRSGDPGIITVPVAGLDADQIRSASSVEGWLPQRRTPPIQNLARNPFLSAGAPMADDGKAVPEPAEAVEVPAAVSVRAPSEILALVKGLRLEVTLISPSGERWAVINGKDYHPGDRVEGLRLVEIQEGKVKLEQGGVTCVLRMD